MWSQGESTAELGDETRAIFKPHPAQVIAAVERGESLPEPIRDKVIERARFALKRVDAASQATKAEVKRLERELWQQEKEATQVRAEADAPLQSNCSS